MASFTTGDVPEIVRDSSRCRSVVALLEKEPVIAMDCEGVNLGREGPLTLIQIATCSGQVYLFDILANSDIFTAGGLKSLLTSQQTVKVIQSCSGDSAALYHQFGITLRNVFDTQIAHLVIEEQKGIQLPRRLKLSEICHRYSETAEVYEQKDDVKIKWTKEVGDYWAIRPLTDEMIAYAAGDVTALVPDLYNNQKRYVEKQGLTDKFQERVEEEVMISTDSKFSDRRNERRNKIVERILVTMSQKYDRSTQFIDLTDEDEKNAVKMVQLERVREMSPVVNSLKASYITSQLDELEHEISTNSSTFEITGYLERDLYRYQIYPNERIQERAKRLSSEVHRIVIADICRKYKVGTPTKMLDEAEKQTLRSQRPSGESDSSYNPVVLSLYWRLMEEDLDATVRRFQENPREFTVSEGYYKKLKFYMNKRTPVPISLKAKTTNFINALDKQFGRNVCPVKKK